MEIFHGNFASAEGVFSSFGVFESDWKDIEFIYACYDTPQYEGYAHVIFKRDGKLYEVNASHCSCYELDGQWEPEETSLSALMFRPNVAAEAKANLKQLYSNLMCFL